MARYDLFSDGEDFLLDLQADTLENLVTRVVVPIRIPERAPKPAHQLNPEFQIGGARYVMVTQFISAIPARELRDTRGNLSHHHDDIVAALEMLFHGF